MVSSVIFECETLICLRNSFACQIGRHCYIARVSLDARDLNDRFAPISSDDKDNFRKIVKCFARGTISFPRLVALPDRAITKGDET